MRETKILRKQLELLAEDSKEVLPLEYKLSQNSLAMAKISKELFKRKCFAAVLFITLLYLFKSFTVKGK